MRYCDWCGGEGCQDCGGSGYASPQFASEDSALRAASYDNPRNLPCPTCKQANRLTPADRDLGYQCDQCADRAERGGW